MGTDEGARDRSITSATLLLRVRDLNDAEAWREFVDRYAPRIYSWAQAKGLQDADAADVTSAVLARLVQTMHKFEYDPGGTFRGWLRTVTHHAISDLADEWRKNGRGRGNPGDESGFDAVVDARSQEDLAAALDRAHDENLRREAEERVRLRVKRRMWQVYLRSCIEGQPAQQVAQSLELSVASVYQYKCRIIKMLADEVQRLERSGR